MFHIPTRKSVEHKKQKCCHPHKKKLGRCRYVHMCVLGCVCVCVYVGVCSPCRYKVLRCSKKERTGGLSLSGASLLSFFPVLSVQSCVILRSDAPVHSPLPLLPLLHDPPHLCVVYENSICLSIFVSLILLDVRAAFKFHDELL